MNIFTSGLRMSPLGIAGMAFKGLRGDYRGNSREFASNLAEQAVAWSIMGLVYSLAFGDDDEELITGAEKQQASEVFHALTTASDQAKQAVTGLTTPPQIKALVGMLTAYEWQFVEEAQRLRSMAVAKLVEETEHPDARIRLKAIELLGKVTEVGLFTERVTVKKEELEDHELDERIREKLKQLQKTVDAEATEKEERNSDAEDVELSLEPEAGEDGDAAESS
jgi:predicted ATP-grasp superfamily ATP-dependent carboligase